MNSPNRDVATIASAIQRALRSNDPQPWQPNPQGTTVQTVLADGIYHANFLIKVSGSAEPLVARFNRQSQWGLSQEDQLKREFSVLLDLEHTKVAPRPVAIYTDCPFPFLVETYAQGEHLDYRQGLSSCARAIAQAHSTQPSYSRPHLSDTPATAFLLSDGRARLHECVRIDNNSATSDLLHDVSDRLSEKTTGPTESVLLHTDLMSKNIIINGQRCVLIDWEGARLGPRAWDLAYFLSPVTARWARHDRGLDESEAAAFIDAYARIAEVDSRMLAGEIREIMPFVIFRALAWCCSYASRSTDVDPEVRERLDLLTATEFVQRTLVDLQAE